MIFPPTCTKWVTGTITVWRKSLSSLSASAEESLPGLGFFLPTCTKWVAGTITVRRKSLSPLSASAEENLSDLGFFPPHLHLVSRRMLWSPEVQKTPNVRFPELDKKREIITDRHLTSYNSVEKHSLPVHCEIQVEQFLEGWSCCRIIKWYL